jgi:hypothetical protein
LKIPISKRAGGVPQGEGSKFQHQYHKKKKMNKIKEDMNKHFNEFKENTNK